MNKITLALNRKTFSSKIHSNKKLFLLITLTFLIIYLQLHRKANLLKSELKIYFPITFLNFTP